MCTEEYSKTCYEILESWYGLLDTQVTVNAHGPLVDFHNASTNIFLILQLCMKCPFRGDAQILKTRVPLSQVFTLCFFTYFKMFYLKVSKIG